MEEAYKIAYQGVPGSFSEAATREFFKNPTNTLISYDTFSDVLQAVSEGKVEYGVLPLENSFTGEVLEVYDLLNQYKLHIVGEQIVKVEHFLLGIKGSSVESLREVYSHPQAFGQCNQFLNNHKDIQRIPYHNTAMAAQFVSEKKDVTKGAIGSKRAGELYGLEVLADDIINTKNNYTKFVIIGKSMQIGMKCDKVSIVFATKHVSGALYSVLSHFAYNGINLLKIHSRPKRDKSWHYYFFIDLEGNVEDTNMRSALEKVSRECEYFRILGSYTQCKEDEIGGIDHEQTNHINR